jgi:hypothetical protein
MAAEHAEIWMQPPLPPIYNFDAPVVQPGIDDAQDRLAADELLLLGMMVYMEQGLMLEWLTPGQEKDEEEGVAGSENRGGTERDAFSKNGSKPT